MQKYNKNLNKSIILYRHNILKISSVELRATATSQSHSNGLRKELLHLTVITNMKFWGISVPWGKEDYVLNLGNIVGHLLAIACLGTKTNEQFNSESPIKASQSQT